jgi:hypothetical protein
VPTPLPPVPQPSRPLVPYSAVRAPHVPTSVRVSVWSLRLAALWGVGSAVAFLWWVRSTVGDVDHAVSAADAVADLGLEGGAARVVQRVLDTASDDRWSGLLTALGVVFLVLSLLAAVVYLLLARAIARGGRVARGVATALTVVSLLWLVLGPQAWVWVALNVAGVVAAWRPDATAYLDAARTGRR